MGTIVGKPLNLRHHATSPIIAIFLFINKHNEPVDAAYLPHVIYEKMAEITDWNEQYAFMDACREIADRFGIEVWPETFTNEGVSKTLYYCEKKNGA